VNEKIKDNDLEFATIDLWHESSPNQNHPQLSEAMPEISRFLGIIIAMYYNDHDPPHFHAKYADFEITVRIADGIVEGRFPRRALNLVLEWYTLHQAELLECWKLARERRPLFRIDPLE
jgi:hypothetical protein